MSTKLFTVEPVKAVDHRNPPKPNKPVKSDHKEDHFKREEPKPIAPAKPVAKPATA